MKEWIAVFYSYAHIPAGSKNIAARRQVFWLAPFAAPSQLTVSGSDCREYSASWAGAYSSGNCTGFSPVSLLIRRACKAGRNL